MTAQGRGHISMVKMSLGVPAHALPSITIHIQPSHGRWTFLCAKGDLSAISGLEEGSHDATRGGK